MYTDLFDDSISTGFLDRKVKSDLFGHAPHAWGQTAFNDRTYHYALFEGKAGASAYREAMERFFAQEYPSFVDRPVLYTKGNALYVAVPDAMYAHLRLEAAEFRHENAARASR